LGQKANPAATSKLQPGQLAVLVVTLVVYVIAWARGRRYAMMPFMRSTGGLALGGRR
jgi:hypothetical protein